MPVGLVHGQRAPGGPLIGRFTWDFQAVVRDKVPFRVRARPFLIILGPPAPEILLRIRPDELADPVRHPDEILVHRDRHPAPADRPQRVPRSEIQGDDSGAVVRVEDHIRCMRRIARGAPIAEPHTLMDIDKLGSGELPALVLEEEGHTILCRHNWEDDVQISLCAVLYVVGNFKEAKPNGG